MDMLQKEFISKSNDLIGKKCWGVVAGEGTGSNVAIDFGKKIKRKTPLRNPSLMEEQKEFESEYSFFISCSWRIETDKEVLCSSSDPNNKEGPMIKGLTAIVNKDVESIDIDLPSYDLTLIMSDSLCLKIFCDQTNEDDPFDNYSYFTDAKIYTVTTSSKLICEERHR